MVGRILVDRYEILEEIGNGGMAKVYKARCRKLNRVVAIKVLKDEYKKDEEFVKKFNRESQAAASLCHPNIVSVFDVGHDGDDYFIVMELVEGINLKEYIKQNPKMDWRTALKFSMQICSALTHAHRNGIVHRDIKPHNIILSKDGNCKVTDFGIASIANLNETKKLDEGILGSVHYISPEHAKGVITDERSDIYSLGVTMYEMLTGVLPFDGDNAVSVAVMHLNSEPKPIKDINIAVPLAFVQIVKKAMSKDILKRYQSANDMYKDLYELSNEPDMFVGPIDISDGKTTKVDVKEVKKRIKEENTNDNTVDDKAGTEGMSEENMIFDDTGSGASSDSDDGTASQNDEDTNENEIVISVKSDKKHTKKNKKGFFKDLFKADTKKDKVAIIAASVVSLLMIGTVIAIAVGILLPGGITLSPKGDYTIPKFEGENIDDIREEYKDIEIEFIIEQEDFNDEYKEGTILTQNPPEGMKVKLPVKVKLTVSKGSRELELASYINKEARQVELEINELGLKYSEKTEYDDEVPAGYVISQYPLPGTEVESGSTVTVTVSKGADEEFAVVPNLIGLTEAEAKAKLNDYELVLGGIIRKNSDRPEGEVIEQSAPAKSELAKKSKVTLTLSNGKKAESNSGSTATDNPPSEENQGHTPSGGGTPTVTVKKYNLTLTLPDDKESVTVKVDQDGKTVYNKTVKTSQQTLNITLEGNGTHSIVVYYDGLLVKTQKIKI